MTCYAWHCYWETTFTSSFWLALFSSHVLSLTHRCIATGQLGCKKVALVANGPGNMYTTHKRFFQLHLIKSNWTKKIQLGTLYILLESSSISFHTVELRAIFICSQTGISVSRRWGWWCVRVRIWGECSTINSLPALFFKVEIRLHTLIPFLRPGSVHSGSASWDDCGRVFPDELRVSSFSDRFPHYVWTAA